MGGERVEVALCDGTETAAAVAALAGMAADEPESEDSVVRVTVSTRAGAVMEAARRLDRAGIDVDDIAVRRPTLDDVFLTLTGHTADEAAESADPDRQADEKVEVAA